LFADKRGEFIVEDCVGIGYQKFGDVSLQGNAMQHIELHAFF
jgi:hypothetical protein